MNVFAKAEVNHSGTPPAVNLPAELKPQVMASRREMRIKAKERAILGSVEGSI